MAGRVARSSARPVAEAVGFVTIDGWSTIFLPCVLLFFLFSALMPVCFSSTCCFVRAAVICSSSASKNGYRSNPVAWPRGYVCVICIKPLSLPVHMKKAVFETI